MIQENEFIQENGSFNSKGNVYKSWSGCFSREKENKLVVVAWNVRLRSFETAKGKDP